VNLSRWVRPTTLTTVAAFGALAIVATTTGYLVAVYGALPDLLVVHFMRNGFPNGFQYKTWPRVLMPTFVQLALGLTLGLIAALLLSRPHGEHDEGAPDVRAAAVAAEAVVLLASIWIVVQAYGAVAITRMWQRQVARLDGYGVVEALGGVLTIVVAIRAHLRLGRPEPRPFVAEHWRFGQLYNNPADPALFVPTRNGMRWTLNFGRPVAAALMGVILVIGIIAPALILGLSLR
jgi:uncharacterized membrane protein